jgi:hypothetical protein
MKKYDDIYSEDFDLKKLKTKAKTEFKKFNIESFPVAATVILHLITLGLFSLIYFGIIQGRFPKIKENDFGTGKSIGFMFIPIFNIYWYFFNWLRLTDRINLQLKLRNKRAPDYKPFMIVSLILSLIPILNYIGAFILMPIVMGLLQHSLNKINKR